MEVLGFVKRGNVRAFLWMGALLLEPAGWVVISGVSMVDQLVSTISKGCDGYRACSVGLLCNSPSVGLLVVLSMRAFCADELSLENLWFLRLLIAPTLSRKCGMFSWNSWFGYFLFGLGAACATLLEIDAMFLVSQIIIDHCRIPRQCGKRKQLGSRTYFGNARVCKAHRREVAKVLA